MHRIFLKVRCPVGGCQRKVRPEATFYNAHLTRVHGRWARKTYGVVA